MNKKTFISLGSSGGIGLLEIILVVNIILKLLGKITWSWPVVFWPLWASIGIIVVFLVIVYFWLKRG